MVEAKNWLVHGRVTEEDVIQRWKCSYQLRKKSFDDKIRPVRELLKEWPILISPVSKILVNNHIICENMT